MNRKSQSAVHSWLAFCVGKLREVVSLVNF